MNLWQGRVTALQRMVKDQDEVMSGIAARALRKLLFGEMVVKLNKLKKSHAEFRDLFNKRLKEIFILALRRELESDGKPC